MTPDAPNGWRPLADELAALTPQQPATVVWRVVELDHLLAHGLPAGRGLDLGCGDGTIARLLRRHDARWTLVGIDPDPLEARLADASGEYEAVHVAPGDAIPVPDGTFDFAFSNSVLEHVPGLPDTLRETARVLRPGGVLIATVPSDELDRCLAGPGMLAPLLGRERDAYVRGLDERTAHVNLWSAERWRTELRAAGLEPGRLTPYMRTADVRRWERLSNWTGGLLYGLSGRRRRPIEITRDLGVATGSRRRDLLAPVARAVVRLAMRGWTPGPRDGDPDAPGHGCLLVEARRPAGQGDR